MTISSEAMPYVLAPAGGIIFINLLTISLDGYDPLYVANNNENVISRGITFLACKFDIALPAQNTESEPRMTLTIANVDRRITEFIRALSVPPSVKLEVITNVDYDTVETTVDFLRMVEVSYDSLQVTANLTLDNWLARRYGETYLPKTYPGLFPV